MRGLQNPKFLSRLLKLCLQLGDLGIFCPVTSNAYAFCYICFIPRAIFAFLMKFVDNNELAFYILDVLLLEDELVRVIVYPLEQCFYFTA